MISLNDKQTKKVIIALKYLLSIKNSDELVKLIAELEAEFEDHRFITLKETKDMVNWANDQFKK